MPAINSGRQPGLFDFDERPAKLAAMDDPLMSLKTEIDFANEPRRDGFAASGIEI